MVFFQCMVLQLAKLATLCVCGPIALCCSFIFWLSPTHQKVQKKVPQKDRKRILLTGGRSPFTLELIRMFSKDGHQVHMAESCELHLSRWSSYLTKNHSVPYPNQSPDDYIEALKNIVISHRIDIIIPTCEDIFWVSRGVPVLSKYCTVYAEERPKLKSVHSKYDFTKVASRAGVKTPETVLVTSTEQLEAIFADLSHDILLKPVFSRFATSIYFRPKSMSDVKGIKVSKEYPWVCQRFITGLGFCTYSTAHRGKISSFAAYPMKMCVDGGATFLFEEFRHERARAWVEKFVEYTNFTGQIAFDFIDDGGSDGLYGIECNPRTTSAVHLFANHGSKTTAFARTFFEPSQEILRPPSGYKSVLGPVLLVLGLPAVRSFAELYQWARVLLTTRDATFSLYDPIPSFWSVVPAIWFFVKGLTMGVNVVTATTFDIEWNGQD